MLSNKLGILNGLHGRIVPGPHVGREPVLVMVVMMMMMMALERRAGQSVVSRRCRAEHVVILVLGVQLDRVLVLVRSHVHHRVVGPGHRGRSSAHASPATRTYGPGAAVPVQKEQTYKALNSVDNLHDN